MLRKLIVVSTLVFGGITMSDVSPVSATNPTETTNVYSAGARWRTIASSSSGEIAVAGRDATASGSKLVLTTDGGTSWSLIETSDVLQWTSVDISSDGQTIVAAGGIAPSYSVSLSSDRGQSWRTLLSSTTVQYPLVSMSNDGTKILVSSDSGELLASTDSGVTFASIATGRNHQSITVSGDGNTMYAAGGNELWKSTDNGSTWTALSAAGVHNFSSVSTSDDGLVILGVVSYEQASGVGAFYSQDGGTIFLPATGVDETFNNQTATGAISSDGLSMIVSTYGTAPQISTDGGATWTEGDFPTIGWLAFAVVGEGSIIYGAAEGSGLWAQREVPPPIIIEASKTSVSVYGGQILNLVGTSFKNVVSITYAGQNIDDAWIYDDSISFTTLATSESPVIVVVTTESGADSIALDTYVPGQPMIHSVSPNTGDWAGGTLVTLSGTDFDDVISVKVGGVTAEVQDWSTTSISFFAPAGRVGLADIEVVTPAGAGLSSRSFRYTWSRQSVLPPFEALDVVSYDGAAFVVEQGPDGRLYIGGVFENAGGIDEADSLVVWDGVNWSALGSDGFGDGALDGDSWVVGIVFGPSGELLINGQLFLQGDTTLHGVLLWDGTNWVSLGVEGIVEDMEFDAAGNLIIVGEFTDAGGTPVSNMARWDGTSWSAVTTVSFNGAISGIELDGDEIIVSGFFSDLDGINEADGLARWDGASWHAIGSNGDGDGFFPEVPSLSMTIEGSGSDRRILVGACLDVDHSGVYVYESGVWQPIATNQIAGCVVRLTRLDDGRLLIVGYFDGVEDRSISGIAVLENGEWSPGGNFDYLFDAIEFGSPSRLMVTGTFELDGLNQLVSITRALGDSEVLAPTTFEPSYGPVEGGNVITIRGANFTENTDVVFGNVAASSVTVVSSTELRVVVPAQSSGDVVISVYDSSRLVQMSGVYRYGSPDPELPATGVQSDATRTIVFFGMMAIFAGWSLIRRKSVLQR